MAIEALYESSRNVPPTTPPLLLFGDRHPPPDLLRARHGPTVLLARFEFRADVQPFHRSELRARFRRFRRGEVQAANEGRGRVSASFEGEAKKGWIRFVQRAEWTHFTTPPNCFRPVCATPIGFSSSTGTKNPGGTGASFFVFESKSHRPRRPQKRHDCCARAGEWLEVENQKKIPPSKTNGRSEKTRFSSVTTRPRRLPLSTARPTRASRTDMRSSRYSPAMLSLTVVALLLACAPVDAAVRVRPVTSLVVLDGVPARTFRRRDVQRDFCRAWTNTIGLDEKVRPRVSPAHVRERRIAR